MDVAYLQRSGGSEVMSMWQLIRDVRPRPNTLCQFSAREVPSRNVLGGQTSETARLAIKNSSGNAFGASFYIF